jgi:glucose 1-dehydrogenase
MTTTMRRFEGKTAVITGSGRGIGQAIAVRLASEGANIVVNDLKHTEDVDTTLAEIDKTGSQGHFVAADVSDVAQVQGLIQQGIDHFGQLDILVNNAGITRKAPFWEVSEADYDLVLNVNLKGAFFAAQAFAKHLLEQKRTGRIVNISSVHEDLPFANFTSYCLSKGGMQMLTRNLAVELGPHNITVNGIAPGAIRTPINKDLLTQPELLRTLRENISLGRVGETHEVSSVVAFVASDEATYVTGATYFVDGGLTWHYEEQ